MKKTILGTLALTALAPLASAGTYHLYYFGGQSNMVGFGHASELPEDMRGPVDGARIFFGQIRKDFEPAEGVGCWSELVPGFGVGANTDGQTAKPAGRFGPEFAFARRMRELRPDENIAIIKYARGGTSIDDRQPAGGTWDPHDTRGEGETPPRANAGVNQYDHALATIFNAIRVPDIDGDGEPDTLVPSGIVWMQGESDANAFVSAADYDTNLAELIELLRAAMHRDDLPFVMGRISDSRLNAGEDTPQWKHGDIVRAAQAEVAGADPHAALVTSTDSYGYSDRAHYDTAGYLDMGASFAEAMHELRED
jgi:hypothetical protein